MRKCLLQGYTGRYIPKNDRGCGICGMSRYEKNFFKYHPLSEPNIDGSFEEYTRIENFPKEFTYMRTLQ